MRCRVLLFAMTTLAACGPAVPVDPPAVGGSGGEGNTSGDSSRDEPTGDEDNSTGSTTSAGDSSSTGAPLPVCEPDATTCEGSEYGVWRLSSPDVAVVAYLYLWPDSDDGPLSFVSRWYVDDPEMEYCTRNGTYLRLGDLDGTFVFQTDGLGGTITDLCGGHPSEHSLRIEFDRRADCAGEVFALEATDSNGASLYAFEGEAVHCDCTIAYDPFSGQGQDLPIENCIAP